MLYKEKVCVCVCRKIEISTLKQTYLNQKQ